MPRVLTTRVTITIICDNDDEDAFETPEEGNGEQSIPPRFASAFFLSNNKQHESTSQPISASSTAAQDVDSNARRNAADKGYTEPFLDEFEADANEFVPYRVGMPWYSHDHAILLDGNRIHCLIDGSFDFLPIGSTLNEFVEAASG